MDIPKLLNKFLDTIPPDRVFSRNLSRGSVLDFIRKHKDGAASVDEISQDALSALRSADIIGGLNPSEASGMKKLVSRMKDGLSL